MGYLYRVRYSQGVDRVYRIERFQDSGEQALEFARTKASQGNLVSIDILYYEDLTEAGHYKA